MTLVNAETGEVIATMAADDARDLTDRIKVTVEGAWHLIKQAYESRAWAALGYQSWDEYCTREFGSSRLRLPREERQEVVASLRESGLSTRAISAATGINRETVMKDLQVVGNQPPDDEFTLDRPELPRQVRERLNGPNPPRVKGRDGKTYAPKAPNTRTRRSPLVDDARTAGWELRKAVERIERVVTDDRFDANREQVAAQLRDHLTHASQVVGDLLEQIEG